jgi:hypothetical protein
MLRLQPGAIFPGEILELSTFRSLLLLKICKARHDFRFVLGEFGDGSLAHLQVADYPGEDRHCRRRGGRGNDLFQWMNMRQVQSAGRKRPESGRQQGQGFSFSCPLSLTDANLI